MQACYLDREDHGGDVCAALQCYDEDRSNTDHAFGAPKSNAMLMLNDWSRREVLLREYCRRPTQTCNKPFNSCQVASSNSWSASSASCTCASSSSAFSAV